MQINKGVEELAIDTLLENRLNVIKSKEVVKCSKAYAF